MSYTDDLRDKYEQAEAKAHKLQADRDEALAKVREKHDQPLRDAIDEAAAAQKAYLDAEAAQALVGRPDAEKVAADLGLTLPE